VENKIVDLPKRDIKPLQIVVLSRFDLSPFAVELAVNNVGVAGLTPLNTRSAGIWLFFDQVFLRSREAALSTFLLASKTTRTGFGQPVDKSVVKLWKDPDKGRGYWLGAIVGLTARSACYSFAAQQANEGQVKKIQNPSQSLVDSGFQLL